MIVSLLTGVEREWAMLVLGRAEREDKNRGRISASRNSEIFEYSFGVF